MKRFALPLLLPVVLLSGCGQPVEDTRPGQPVKHRQLAFKDMLKSFEPMGVMLRTDHYDAEKFLALANELAQRKDAPWPYFQPDTDYPPTKSKPEVWSEPARFEQEKQAFLAATDELQRAAAGRDKAVAEKAYAKVYAACDSCHKGFKAR